MKRKNRKGHFSQDLDIVRDDWPDDDPYESEDLDDGFERGFQPRVHDDEDDWDDVGNSQFDLERWHEDLKRRSSHRQRIRNNDMDRGLWGSMGG